MRTLPILFNDAMVQAILEGRKTQTRRELKVQPKQSEFEPSILHFSGLTKKRQIIGGKVIPKGEYWSGSSTVESYAKACPFGQVGDQLWVREAWAKCFVAQAGQEWYVYRTCDNRTDYGGPWKPSIHMPRKASRIQLEITGVRVERLNDCSDSDALSEGYPFSAATTTSVLNWYRELWESINGEGSWDVNPWVWVVEFKVIKP